MTPKEVALFLRSVIPYADTPAIFVWGPPGIGKSAVVAQTAEALDIEFIDIDIESSF